LLDIPGGDVMAALWGGRLAEAGHSLDALRAHGVVALDDTLQGSPVAAGFDACPEALHDTLTRAEPIFDALACEPTQQFKLITRRTNTMLNSGFHNVKALKQLKGARSNPLYMNPADAEHLGLADGQTVIVRNEYGEVVTGLTLDEALRTGVVAMSHGFGNAKTAGMPVAQASPGVNVNILSPTGPGSFDPVSAMSQLTGIAVEVVPA
jgi:anaerobic selenocysteine-containing dehydrogenase